MTQRVIYDPGASLRSGLAKLHDLQNRLGFVVALARQVAERNEQPEKASALAVVEAQLEPSRLAREDTLCRESMTQA